MERLEGCRLAGQCHFFLALFCPMVCDGKKEAGGRAAGVLVVEFDGFASIAFLFAASAGFGFYFRVCFHLDSLHPKSGDSSAAQKSSTRLSGLFGKMSAAVEFLSALRREIGGNYFLTGAAGTGTIPCLFRTGRKSGCVRPKPSSCWTKLVMPARFCL